MKRKLLLCLTAHADTEDTEMHTELLVDFSTREGVPLLKKFGLFNSGLVTLKQYDHYAHCLDDLRVDALRIDLFMGSRGQPMGDMVQGSAENLTYDFTALDHILNILAEKDSKLYASWCYIPLPLQKNGNWRSGPTDLAAWEAMFTAFGEHAQSCGVRIPYHEIYNEPDCNGVFFTGSFDDYTQMYLAAARGLKAGAPDAVIGGPSTAFIENSVPGIRHFLNEILENRAPLDFFSYHSYGCDAKQYIARTRLARNLLDALPALDATELHLNEFNSLLQPFVDGGPAERARGGATMLTAFELLLDETDVTLCQWAQWLDTGIEPLGSVDVQGRAKAAFWAYWMYQQMPEERVAVQGLPDPFQEGLHAMASRDQGRAAILMWNDHPSEARAATLSLGKLPISGGEIRLYAVDDLGGYPYPVDENGLLLPQKIIPVSEIGSELDLCLQPGGMALYLFDSGKAQQKAAEPGTLIRKRYYFTERGKKNYAFYDETDPMVYLGMNGEIVGRSTVAIECENLPSMLMLQSAMSGTYEAIDQNSAFTVRVDYEVDGSYQHACVWSFMPMNARRKTALPWGTQQEAEEVIVESTLLTGKTLLTLSSHAPKGWSGRAVITFDLQDAGANLKTEIRMLPVR